MPTPAQTRDRALPLLLILGVAVACVAISSQSFWIDEAGSAVISLQPTLRDAWNALYAEHSSNMQLPLHFIYFRIWSDIFGGSEYAFRASNLPWFFLGFFSILHFLRRNLPFRDVTLLVFCLHPFIWYYLNEARPYAMELSGAMLVCGALYQAMERPDELLPASWWWLYAFGLVILCGSTLVGVPWAGCVTLLLITLPGFRRSVARAVIPALVFVPLLLLLAVYFAWTFKEKVRNAYLPTTFASALSVFYELLGFVGLGPGRNDLRIHSVSAIRPYLLPLACLAIPLAAGLAFACRRRFGLSRRQLGSLLLVAGIPTALTLTLGVLRHARMLARHFTPLFPFLLAAVACAVLLLWKKGGLPGRIAAGLIVICLACSSVEIRFAARHKRDDYRSAAAAARDTLAQGKTVWWAADPAGAIYYHVPISSRGEVPAEALSTYALPPKFTSPPDEIVLSKPDLFDFDGSIAAFIASHHYIQVARLQSFTIWVKPPAGA